MVMNKKEKALVEDLEVKAALRWTCKLDPDVEPPTTNQDAHLKKGFMYNSHSLRVLPACTSSIYHAIGRDDKTTTQNPKRLYSTKVKALSAMRFEIEVECAKKLRKIDKMIAANADLEKINIY